MRVQLLGEVSGTRNGQQWPPRLSVVDLPDDEALPLVATRMARLVADAEESQAVVEPVEDRRFLDGPADAAVKPPGRIEISEEAGTVRRRRA